MGQESPDGVLEQVVAGDHDETDEDAGREADIKGEFDDVVCGASALAIYGLECQGFIFYEIVRRKGLEGQTLSEGVIDTARPPQCEFSFFQTISSSGNHFFIRISLGPLGLTCWDPSLKLLLPLRRRMSGKGALEKTLTAALES